MVRGFERTLSMKAFSGVALAALVAAILIGPLDEFTAAHQASFLHAEDAGAAEPHLLGILHRLGYLQRDAAEQHAGA